MRRPNSPARRPRETFGERRERRAGVSDVTEVLDAAARFLETRSRSTAEVRRRLATAGYRPGLVDEAIERLAAQRYLDDEAFARSWVESRDRARRRGRCVCRKHPRCAGQLRRALSRDAPLRWCIRASAAEP